MAERRQELAYCHFYCLRCWPCIFSHQLLFHWWMNVQYQLSGGQCWLCCLLPYICFITIKKYTLQDVQLLASQNLLTCSVCYANLADAYISKLDIGQNVSFWIISVVKKIFSPSYNKIHNKEHLWPQECWMVSYLWSSQ